MDLADLPEWLWTNLFQMTYSQHHGPKFVLITTWMPNITAKSALELPAKISKLSLILDQAIYGSHLNNAIQLPAWLIINMIQQKVQAMLPITLNSRFFTDQEKSLDSGLMIQLIGLELPSRMLNSDKLQRKSDSVLLLLSSMVF